MRDAVLMGAVLVFMALGGFVMERLDDFLSHHSMADQQEDADVPPAPAEEEHLQYCSKKICPRPVEVQRGTCYDECILRRGQTTEGAACRTRRAGEGMDENGQRTDLLRSTPKKNPGSLSAVALVDTGKSVGILLLATLLGFLFAQLGFTEANIITVYILAVLLIAVFTGRRVYSLVASVVSVLVFNFFFTAPRFTFQAYGSGYPVTFIIMFLAALLMGSLATRLKEQAKESAKAAYRTKVLLDTNQLLQQVDGRDEILAATAAQLVKLLGRDMVAYPAQLEGLGKPQFFPAPEGGSKEDCVCEVERAVAAWVWKHNRRAGATTDTFPGAKHLYLAIRTGARVYGVVGVAITHPLDISEYSVLLSILGECALALENEQNAREKEAAAVLAQNEQLRANLLRAISHDLRTPLTSISGNASNLMSNGGCFDEETKRLIYSDIYDDAMWLISLVENLLSVTRIEEGHMSLSRTTELMDEVVTEALRHLNRKSVEHTITVESAGDYLLAQMDAKLIVQVVINLVDNAIKYTPPGSQISITTEKRDGHILVRVADNGPGIPDEMKPRIFDMFYTGKHLIADSRRSLGLGLSLCKSIIQAHGGRLTVEDHPPRGAVFQFTLPAGEVTLHE